MLPIIYLIKYMHIMKLTIIFSCINKNYKFRKYDNEDCGITKQ